MDVDSFFLVDVSNYSGYMQEVAWNWINKERKS
jgi:hypothetical protein